MAAKHTKLRDRTRFFQGVVARKPDPEVPGWNEIRLDCGHVSYQPEDNRTGIAYCAECAAAYARAREAKTPLAASAEIAGGGN